MHAHMQKDDAGFMKNVAKSEKDKKKKRGEGA